MHSFPREAPHLAHPAPRQDAAVVQADDEVPAVPDEVVVERGPVAAPVVHRHALAAGGLVHGLHDLQHLVVLALDAWRPRRPELEREGDGLPAADAARRHDAPVVAVDEDVPPLLRGAACVPDERDVFHRAGELLAYLRRIEQEERAVLDEANPVVQHGLGHGLPQHAVVEVPAQPLLRVYRPYVVVYRPHDR